MVANEVTGLDGSPGAFRSPFVAGSGFGAGISALFAREGADVVVADIDGAAAERVAQGIVEQGGKAVAVAADVTGDADTARMVETATRRSGRLDVLVNNAGVSHWNAPLTEVSEADFDRVFAVNVKSLFWAARHAVPVMTAQGGGAIVNTASTAGLRPRPGLCWYNGSKGACITITKSMAVELAPQRVVARVGVVHTRRVAQRLIELEIGGVRTGQRGDGEAQSSQPARCDRDDQRVDCPLAGRQIIQPAQDQITAQEISEVEHRSAPRTRSPALRTQRRPGPGSGRARVRWRAAYR